MPGPHMVPLVTASGDFHARVIAARLGADGIVTELRGAVSGVYFVPGEVDVLVSSEDLEEASQLLMADEVEAVFDHVDVRPSLLRRTPILVLVGFVVLVAWTVVATLRGGF